MPVLFAFSMGGLWIVFSGFLAISTFFGVLFGDQPKPLYLRLPYAMFCYLLVGIVFWGFGDLVFGRTILFRIFEMDQ